ncbi:hypothetical protein BZG36_00948 [Bifiguratus adelaidae]|uniref:PH domain-containing protein n=1 Tax=Bifiguratus adelaidae TaxID=1938954 RepID=A0A261Y5C6_9FUNG|nr:hypothetical protein BZG36_00948 [Bifiguratus adelaidae]
MEQMALHKPHSPPLTPLSSHDPVLPRSVRSNTIISTSTASSTSSAPDVSSRGSLSRVSEMMLDNDTVEVVCAGDIGHSHGSTVFKKTKFEYCVLTTHQLLRFKSQGRAAQVFNEKMLVPGSGLRKPASSIKVSQDNVMVNLDSVFAVHEPIAVPFAIRIEHVHPVTKASIPLTITTDSSTRQNQWLQGLRKAVLPHVSREAILHDTEIQMGLDRLKRQNDVPEGLNDQMLVYKVKFNESVKHETKIAATDIVFREVCPTVLFVLGKSNFYILPVASHLADYKKVVDRDRFGLLAIQNMTAEARDDTLKFMIRQRTGEARQLRFATSFSEQIVHNIRQCIASLLPLHTEPPYSLNCPAYVLQRPITPQTSYLRLEDRGFDQLLEAYCAALNVDKRRYNLTVEKSPDALDLLRVTLGQVRQGEDLRGEEYNKYELLAFFRALHNNTMFRDIMVANVDLSEMERWIPSKTDSWAIEREIGGPNVLAYELYTLITGNKKLRHLDLGHCNIGRTSSASSALCSIGKAMLTEQVGINSIVLSGNRLTASDVQVLLQGICVNRKAIKALGLGQCGLRSSQLDAVLDTLASRSPEHLNILDISDNTHNIPSSKLDHLLRRATHLKVLKIRLIEVGLDPAILARTRLRILDISQRPLSSLQVTTLCQYIKSPAFTYMQELILEGCHLNGYHIQELFASVTESQHQGVHVSLASNPIAKELGLLPRFVYGLMHSQGPSSLSLAQTEWDDQAFREVLISLQSNAVIRDLDLSGIRLLGDISLETSKAMKVLFERNKTIETLNLAGGAASQSPPTDNRDSIGKLLLGSLDGLSANSTIQRLILRGNNLGNFGAEKIGAVLAANKSIKYIDLDENKFSIEGFKALLVSLENNTALIEMPRPQHDLTFQMVRLTTEIRSTYQSENELKFMVAHTTGEAARRAKETMEIQAQGRKAAEWSRQRIGGVVDDLMRITVRNRSIQDEIKSRAQSITLQLEGASLNDPSLSTSPMISVPTTVGNANFM